MIYIKIYWSFMWRYFRIQMCLLL